MYRSPMLALLCACVVFAGCANVPNRAVGVQGISSPPAGAGAQARFSSDSTPGIVLLWWAFANDVRDLIDGAANIGARNYAAPDPDPTRRVSEQDCTKPVDVSAGNLKCR